MTIVDEARALLAEFPTLYVPGQCDLDRDRRWIDASPRLVIGLLAEVERLENRCDELNAWR
jgi:hypothetical protein